MFVARDKNGQLFLFYAMPVKQSITWDVGACGDYLELNKNLFPEVKWEDEKPLPVKLVRDK